jgi:hypothetical protein
VCVCVCVCVCVWWKWGGHYYHPPMIVATRFAGIAGVQHSGVGDTGRGRAVASVHILWSCVCVCVVAAGVS